MNDIRNCEFRFKCPKQWDALKPTDNEDQRYCNECNQIVYFCHTPDELMAAIQANRCVAIRVETPSGVDTRVGMMDVKYGEQK